MADEREGRISLKIDLSAGTIEIDAPAGDFHNTVDKAKELLGQIPQSVPVAKSSTLASEVTPKAPAEVTPFASKENQRSKTRSGRTAGGSQGRVGRIGSFEPVDLGLNEAQERELRAFMDSKKPSEQPDQVAVVMYKGEQLLGRKGFSYNEIYSLLRLSGVRDLPKALDVLLSRLVEIQWVVRDGPQIFSLKFVGRDHVERELGKEIE